MNSQNICQFYCLNLIELDLPFKGCNNNNSNISQRRDSTDGRAAALYPADPGSNPVVSMLQRALRLSVSAGRQTQLIMNRSWSWALIVALLHWLDYKTLQLLLLVVSYIFLANFENS